MTGSSDLSPDSVVRETDRRGSALLTRRAGDIIPLQHQEQQHQQQYRLHPVTDSTNSVNDDQASAFYHYKPPTGWITPSNPQDIAPHPSNVPGGINLANQSRDIHPVSQHQEQISNNSDHNISSSVTHSAMTANTRPSDLRVQAAMSRESQTVSGRRPPPVSSSPTPSPRKYLLKQFPEKDENNLIHKKVSNNNNNNNMGNASTDELKYEWVNQMEEQERRRTHNMKPVQYLTPCKWLCMFLP